jgi:hypothetical protein
LPQGFSLLGGKFCKQVKKKGNVKREDDDDDRLIAEIKIFALCGRFKRALLLTVGPVLLHVLLDLVGRESLFGVDIEFFAALLPRLLEGVLHDGGLGPGGLGAGLRRKGSEGGC